MKPLHLDFWIGRYRIVLDVEWSRWMWAWDFKPMFGEMKFWWDLGPFGMELWRAQVHPKELRRQFDAQRTEELTGGDLLD